MLCVVFKLLGNFDEKIGAELVMFFQVVWRKVNDTAIEALCVLGENNNVLSDVSPTH